MSIKIETYGSLLVAAAVVWYLARRTNLGGAFVSDVQAIPGQLTGYFRGSQTSTTRPLRDTETYRRTNVKIMSGIR